MTKLKNNPLNAYPAGCFVNGDVERPVPLKHTSIEVSIDGGLATVTTQRSFTNNEAVSIEATMTFPVPVSAVLVSLSAKIGERELVASAQARQQARTTYEDAIEGGRSAVLHEEVLKGVHMLTVGHIAPGASLVVETTWVQPLAFSGNDPGLRIPTTVGDIYGRSPLIESDDLVHGAVVHRADLAILSTSGSPRLTGYLLENGKASITLDAPIDITLDGWEPKPVVGFDGRGNSVEVRLQRCGDVTSSLDLVVLADRSGSMRQASHGDRSSVGLTKFDAMTAGLRAASAGLLEGDRLELWQFDQGHQKLGVAVTAAAAVTLVDTINPPGGSTEIGSALSAIIAQHESPDILLITDGKSHHLDVLALAQSGSRVSVVLIGEDALEARVGHLAALTGGQIFVASSDDAAEAIKSAIQSTRSAHLAPRKLQSLPTQMDFARGGAAISVAWKSADGTGIVRDAIGAYAAGLVMPLFDEAEATAIAVENGIVSHLTSLVLVDDQSTGQGSIPAQRKVPLSTPRTAKLFAAAPAPRQRGGVMRGIVASSANLSASIPDGKLGFEGWFSPGPFEEQTFEASAPVFPMTGPGPIDWDASPEQLVAGDIMGLPLLARTWIAAVVTIEEVARLAAELGIRPSQLVIGLLAFADRGTSRTAARVAKALLPASIDAARLTEMLPRLRLQATA